MAKSASAKALDGVQARLAKGLLPAGYRRRGRTFHREAGEGIVQVVNLQMRAFMGDRPGQRGIVDRFTVNLGIHVPELRPEAPVDPAALQEYDCALRIRIGHLMDPPRDHWWDLPADAEDADDDVARVMEARGLPWLARFGTRDGIVEGWMAFSEARGTAVGARVEVAIIRGRRGERDEAHALLQAQRCREGNAPAHVAYLDALAADLGLPPLASCP